MAQDLIKLLKCFNRKERFFLVGAVLDNCEFRLSPCFRGDLQCAVGLKEEIPECAFAAMDYHLDWVAAALAKSAGGEGKKTFLNRTNGNRQLVKGNQEDVDFLVAFRGNSGTTEIVFLEAKAYSAWDYKQLRSKAERLKLIFGKDGKKQQGVRPRFCMVGNTPPDAEKLAVYPTWWMQRGATEFNFLKLQLPKDRIKVTRWDACNSRASRYGEHFRITGA